MQMCSDLLKLWWRAADEPDSQADIRAELEQLSRTVNSRRSREDLQTLLDVLFTGSGAEAQAWWAVLTGWPYGFPPAVSLTPYDRYQQQ